MFWDEVAQFGVEEGYKAIFSLWDFLHQEEGRGL